MHPYINTAIKAARSAAKILMSAQERLDSVGISEKGKNNLVTDADIASEKEIIYHLRKAYPDHGIIAEESGHHEGKDEYTWVIDPLDGTMNFTHGFPYFCISIACLYKGRPEHAVIYNPNLDDLFIATRGAGAQKNGLRIRGGKRAKLADAMVASGLPASARHLRDAYNQALAGLATECASMRHNGAAALDLAHVASGQLDGFWEFALAPWDVAAGSLIVKEAGGMANDFKGGDGYMQHGHIMAANPKIFKQLLDVLKPHLPDEVIA